MTLVETLCAILAALAGTGFLVASARAASTIRHVLWHRTSRVIALTNGPAKIAGTLSARDPIIGLDGTAAVAAWRKVSCRPRSDADGGPPTLHAECAEIEVTDDSGSCLLEIGAARIVGPSRSYTFSSEAFAERFPALWADVSKAKPWFCAGEIVVDETLVPDGSNGVVSGRASLDDAGTHHGGGYRDGNRRVKLTGDDEHPLILSAWEEKPLLRHLGGPLLGVAWIGVLLWLLAVATAALPVLLAHRVAL
jgi:hypothetical protein